MSDTNPLQAPSLRPHEVLAQRIQSGETIPLSDLIAFIESSDKTLTTERKAREKLEKPDNPLDVDFF